MEATKDNWLESKGMDRFMNIVMVVSLIIVVVFYIRERVIETTKKEVAQNVQH